MAWLKTNQKQYKNEQKRIDEYMDYKTEKALKAHKESSVLDHPDGSVTDEKIGERTVVDASTDSGNFTGLFSAIINNIANAIRSIRTSFNTHKNNSYIHIKDAERQNWNSNMDKTAEVEQNLEKAIEEQREYVDKQDSEVLNQACTAAVNFTNARVKEVKQTLDQNIASVQENLEQANNEIADIKEETAEIGDNTEANADKLNSLKYYGDMNIVPSDASLFFFKTDDETMTASVSAASTSIAGDIVIPYQYVIDNKVYLVTKIGTNSIYDTTVGEGNGFYGCSNITGIIIPNSVTSIGSYAFTYCKNLTDITIPDSVTNIPYRAFMRCTNLTSVIIPDGITIIADDAFRYCSNLTSITILDGVTSIGNYAFSECSNLTSITIPDSVTSIKMHAFSYCESLVNIKILNNSAEIGDCAFASCSNLENIDLPKNITKIAYCLFSECAKINNILIPKSVVQIGRGAFQLCGSFTDVYYEGTEEEWNAITFDDSSQLTIGRRAIHYNSTPAMKGEVDALASQVKQANTETAEACDSIEKLKSLHYYGNLTLSQYVGYLDESQFGYRLVGGGAAIENVSKDISGWVVIPSEVKYTDGDGETAATRIVSIGNSSSPTAKGAFKDCTGLIRLYMPKYIELITACSFQGCSSLSGIYIPARVEEILANAFLGCDSLKYVYYGGTEAQWNKIRIDAGNDMLKNAKIYYCSFGCDEDYIINMIGDLEESCATKEEVEDAISPLQANWENMIEAVSANERNIGSHGDRITALETSIGDIATALDNIIAIQNTLIGGETV